LAGALFGLGAKAEGDLGAITLELNELQKQLQDHALENQARKNALARVNLAIDHMASLESPYVETGKLQLVGSIEDVTSQLNLIYEEELAKLNGSEKPAASSLPAQNPAGNTNATVYNASTLLKHLDTKKLTRDQLIMLRSAVRSLGNDQLIVEGTVEELRAYRESTGKIIPDEMLDDNVNGFYVSTDKTIYLINRADNSVRSELITHEMVHAATYAKLIDFFNNNGENLTQEERDAIERLDALMEEWLAAGLTGINDAEAMTARKDAVAQVQEDLAKGDRGGAINEFMAWTLANTKLAAQSKELKTKTSLKRKVIDALKKLLGIKIAVSDDVFSNLRFNTMVLMAAPTNPSIYEIFSSTVRTMKTGFGTNERLVQIRQRIADKVAVFINSSSNPAEKSSRESAAKQALARAQQTVRDIRSHGWSMNAQESSTFRITVATLATEAYLNPNALSRLQDIYDHVVKNLTVEHFMADPSDDTQRYMAQEKLNAIIGAYGTVKDAQGRSTLMSAFLGLAIVSDEFRNVLAQIEVPKPEKNKGNSLDEVLENLGTSAMDNLSKILSGEGRKAENVRASVDALAETLAETVQDEQTMLNEIAGPVQNLVDKANTIIVQTKDDLSNKAVDKLQQLEANANNKYTRGLYQMGQVVASVVQEDRSKEIQKGWMSILNRSNAFRWFRELNNEMIGRTEENAPVFDLIKVIRSSVQQLRQQFREHLPETITKQFNRKVTKDEWTSMFNALGKTDIASLREANYSMTRILSFLKTPGTVASEISVIEERLNRLDPAHSSLWIKKAKELAIYMNTGQVTTTNLLRNANAIAELIGELGPRAARVNVTPALVTAIDQLTTFYAFEGLPQATKDSIADLAQNETSGMDFVISNLIGNRQTEITKVNTWGGMAKHNYFKGHVPTENRPGISLIVAEDKEEGQLKLLGYTRVGAYKGSPAERGNPPKGYYFAPLAGRAMYNQGNMQNVRATAYGVDPMTGFSIGRASAGVITDAYTVEQIRRQQRLNTNQAEALLPIYDNTGLLVAWERAMDPNQEARMERNTHLAEAIGIWSGRQIEEEKARQFNHQLIDMMYDRWREDEKENRTDEYINVFSDKQLKKDKVLLDAVKLITPETRAYIESVFGEGEFWVRDDMLNDAIGYRSPSVGDAWTGVTRLNPEVGRNIRNFTTSIFGVEAYKYVVTAEKFWQNFVGDARTTIVVKSVVVAAANMISNIYHLSSVGVPIQSIARGITRKTAEINTYMRGRLRHMELSAEMRVAVADNKITDQRRLKAEIQAIEDSWKRLSIWPLLQAGELSSISDAGITQDETLLAEGKLNDYIEKLASKLPDSVRTAGRYAIISKDTALFKGLQKAVAYGDFIGKAILYDDLVQRKKQSSEQALARISEEFIHYDRLAGRTRSYLENMGVLWFWNFKLRAAKVAISTIRNNPLHAFLTMLVPQPTIVGSIGSPISDNIFSVAADGRIQWSVGPGQGFRAYTLHPGSMLIP
jgi:hypothetical protein